MTFVTIEPRGERAEVRFAFDRNVNAIIKGVIGFHFDMDTKLWTIPTASVPHLEARLHHRGYPVKVLGAIGSGDWAEAIVKRIGCDGRLYKRLTKALHPDVGGDERMQQELNDTYRRCCGRR